MAHQKLTKAIADTIANKYIADMLRIIIYDTHGYMQGLSIEADYFEDYFREELYNLDINYTKVRLAMINESFTRQLADVKKRVEKVHEEEMGRYAE